MIRVFIADDHEVVRSGLRQLFAKEIDIEICGEMETAVNIDLFAEHSDCDVLVLDINMPGNPGPETVREIVRKNPDLAVLIFTMYPEDSHAVAYLRAGARAFLSKRRSVRELAEAIRVVAEGKRYITPELANFLVQYDIDLSKTPDRILSSREIQVVRKLAQGARSKQIAEEIGVSQSTVNTFVQRIKIKLGLNSVVEIVEFARENGLLG